MKVLLDINILIDVFLARNPWLADSAAVVQAGLDGKITAYLSAASLPIPFNVAKTQTATSNRGSVASRPTCLSIALISLSQDFRSRVQTAAQTIRAEWSASSKSSRDSQRISI
jgi:hypothetical protein